MRVKFIRNEYLGMEGTVIDYTVIDTKFGTELKRNIKKASKAAAYVRYHTEEIAKAEKNYLEMEAKWAT